MISLDIIISTYNSPLTIVQILSLLGKNSLLPNSIHIADDGSKPSSRQIIEDCLDNYHIQSSYHWHKDKGFRKSKILNHAISKCKSDYIVFLDGDCLPHKHFIRDHLYVAEKGYFVQGRRCFVHKNEVQRLLDKKTTIFRLILSGKVSGVLKSIRLPKPHIKRNTTMHGLLGCNLAAWKEDLLSVNGFDEDYEGWGREDSDLGARMYNSGLKRKVVYGRALVYHLNHQENERKNLKKNDRLLQETIQNGKVRCKNGIIKE